MSWRSRNAFSRTLLRLRSRTASSPGLHGGVQLRFQALKPLGLLRHRVHVLLEHDLLRRRRTDDVRQPAEMGRVPVRAALVANVLAQQERLQPYLAPFEIAHRVLA